MCIRDRPNAVSIAVVYLSSTVKRSPTAPVICSRQDPLPFRIFLVDVYKRQVLVIENTELADQYRAGEYEPLSTEQADVYKRQHVSSSVMVQVLQ